MASTAFYALQLHQLFVVVGPQNMNTVTGIFGLIARTERSSLTYPQHISVHHIRCLIVGTVSQCQRRADYK